MRGGPPSGEERHDAVVVLPQHGAEGGGHLVVTVDAGHPPPPPRNEGPPEEEGAALYGGPKPPDEQATKPQQQQSQRQHWMEVVRVVQANFLVYYHNMRFFDGKRNWVRVATISGIDDPRAVHQYQVGIHSVQRAILQVGLNMFFMLSGASSILSMKEKQNLWRVMGERFFKLIVAFFFGYLIMALPVSLIMLMYKEGTIINASADAWKEVLFTSPGQLYFLPYMFALWVLHLPLFCVMKACHDAKGQRSSGSSSSSSSGNDIVNDGGDESRADDTTSYLSAERATASRASLRSFDQMKPNDRSSWSIGLFLCGTVLAPLLWMWCWLGFVHGTILVSVLCAVVIGSLYFVVTWRTASRGGGKLPLGAFLHYVQLNFLDRFMTFYFDLKYDWMIPMSTLAPSLLLTWANQYFDSFLINTGIVLIYVLPLLTAALPLPTTITITFSSLLSFSLSYSSSSPTITASSSPSSSSSSSNGKHQPISFSINLPLLSLLSIVIGHILIISAPDILGPDDIPRPTSYFNGLIPVSPDMSKSLGTSFFTSVSHSAFYVFGFAWMLFMDKLPCFWTSSSNLVLAIFFVLNLFLLRWSFPDQDEFVFVGPGYITFRPRLKRFFYVVGSWYWMWLYAQLSEYHGNFAFTSRLQTFVRDSTFGLFIIHPLFEYLLVCSMNRDWFGLGKYTWGQKAVMVNVFTFGMSYLTVYLLLKIPAIAPFLGVKPQRTQKHRSSSRAN